MKKWLYILTISMGIIFLMPMTTTTASNGDATLFGPQTFVRGKGKPVKETVEFSIPMATEVTLWITNGTEPDQSKRVSSAIITLNGHNILGPNELNQNVAQIKKSIPVLAGTNSLTAELRSKPGGQISVRLAISVDKMVLVPVFKPIDIGGEPLTVTAIVGSVQTPVPTLASNVAVTFTINGLGDIPPVIVTTDENGKAVATFQGFEIPGQGTLTASVVGTSLSASTDIQVITKPSIFLDQGPTELTILAGSHRYTAFGVNLLKDDGIPYHVTFNQTIDGNGIALFHDYEGGWFRTGPMTFMVNERIEALTQGTYTMTSTATLVETGESESKELVIKVVTPEELDQLSLTPPSFWQDGINIGVPTEITVTSSVIGAKNPPTTLTLEEVNENGAVIATLGELKNDGTHGDLVAGDRNYSEMFTISETIEGKKLYRTTTMYNGQLIISDIGFLLVTQFPIGTIPANPDNLVHDPVSGDFIFSDEVTIAFVEGTSPERIEEIVETEGATIVGMSASLGAFQLRIPGDGTAEFVWAIVTALREYTEVRYATPVGYIRGHQSSMFPNDMYVSLQRNITTSRADETWLVAKGQEMITIAIVDSGVDYTHEELKNKVITGYDFIEQDNDPMDVSGHGTSVAGVAGAESNNF
ncbi:secreted protein [Beggiatoa sp. PS]|nr:secreted protein [Beggiatoa sp. PS]